MSHADLLRLLLDNAAAMRESGVLSVEIGTDSIKATLAPHDPPMIFPDDEEPEERDVLDDPDTFGRLRTVPGRNREKAER